ncbi:MAG TPA: type II toxin-antitoxin system VapC family toxin [Bacteroidota bacterium]|nr:type II toxin-antitoxin system VapC family toxin [Bacteroidota bacterium]
MIYLLDTDIIIYSIKAHETVQKNFRRYAQAPMYISVVTYGELYFGAEKSKSPQKNLSTVQRIGEIFPVIDVTKSIMETFGRLKAGLGRKGNVLDDMDLIIASTAMTHNYTLVTNNEKHFRKIPDLQIENWSVTGSSSASG